MCGSRLHSLASRLNVVEDVTLWWPAPGGDRKSTRLNSSHSQISYAVFCLKKKNTRVLRRPHLRAHDVGAVCVRKTLMGHRCPASTCFSESRSQRHMRQMVACARPCEAPHD